MSSSGKNLRYKITVIGDGRVGKTSLISKYTLGAFDTDYVETIGAQFSKYDKEIGGDSIRLLLWDIACQDSFDFLGPSFYRESDAAIIVFSLEENQLGSRSFNNIINWYQEVNQFCGYIPIVLFANKVDLINEDEIDHPKIQKIVKKNKFLSYYITSTKTGQGVHNAFDTIIENL
ncbi:MAG: GTP-binding protein [Candidatus Lokiarchaeota archaeon]|nr:GTP-binding protein [Candidatus Lokiarchaeota archaeon]